MFVTMAAANNTPLSFRIAAVMCTEASHSNQLATVYHRHNEFLSRSVRSLSLTSLLFVMVDARVLTTETGFSLGAVGTSKAAVKKTK